MKTIYTFILLAFFSLSLPSTGWAEQLKGSGKVQKEQRQITPFSKVSVSTAVELIVTQGPALPTLTVEAEDNILPYIETKIVDNTLKISINSKSNNSINPTQPMKVYITAIEVSEFKASSAAKIIGTNIWKANKLKIDASSAAQVNMDVNAKELDIEASSASQAKIKGECANLEMDVTSAAKVDAEELTAKVGEIEVSSAGSANVKVTETISYDVSSAGKLTYKGNPQLGQTSVGKSGKVTRR